jgi:acylphosphatase
VQGVGFRWFVRETSRRLGLAGWVENRPDGSVEIAAEGDEESLDLLERAVHGGPPAASVSAVERVSDSGEPLTEPFSVRRRKSAE